MIYYYCYSIVSALICLLLILHSIAINFFSNQTKTINFFHKNLSFKERLFLIFFSIVPVTNLIALVFLSFSLLEIFNTYKFVFASGKDKRVQAIKRVLRRKNYTMSKALKNKETRKLFDSILEYALAISEDPFFEKTNILGLQEDVLINIPNKAYACLGSNSDHVDGKLKKLYQEMEDSKMILWSENFFEDTSENTTGSKPSLNISFSKK